MAEQKSDLPVEQTSQGPPPMPGNWSTMTGDQRFEFMAGGWATAKGKSFTSSEIAKKYELRTKRWLDVVALKEPDKVPVTFLSDGFVVENAGLKPVDSFYNPEKAAGMGYKFHEEFDSAYAVGVIGLPGSAFDLLGYKQIRWPGSKLPGALSDDMQFQYVEKEYMPASEYDQLIENPEGYLLRNYLPRVCDGLKGLEMFPSLYNAVEAHTLPGLLAPFARGPLREAIDNLLKAADLSMAHMEPFIDGAMKVTSDFGAPATMGSVTFTPFDLIGDTMRGTTGMMLDMYRCPDKVVAACEALVPVAINIAVSSAMVTRNPFVLIPLHKGADGFMSDDQFRKFYWPTFKALLLGLIDAGLIPMPFVEGSYNQRLDVIAEAGLPKGKTIWMFDRTDMKNAKAKFGDFACVGGNVPASLFSNGSVEMLEDYCKELMDYAAPGGGFFLAPGAVIDQAKPENVRAFLNIARKFGVYQGT